jgi:hypothetical protein
MTPMQQAANPKPRLLRCLLPAACCLLSGAAARADGGVPRLSERAGGYRLSVFTSPTPFRAGPVDVSVLVQDADSGELVSDVQVTIRAVPRGWPEQAIIHPATAETATNKLYRAAVFDLSEPGWWEMEVTVEGDRGPARVSFALEAGDPPPRWWALAPWIGWPALAVALFSLHLVLVRRKARCAGSRPPGRRGPAPKGARRDPRTRLGTRWPDSTST